MHGTRSRLLVGLLLTCAVGCQSAAKEQNFSHQHRLDYVISDAELENLKFLTSTKVFVKAIGEVPEFDKSGSGVIIAPMGIEGRVIAVGPDWLKVTFGLGNGAYFKTDTSKPYDRYWLATEVEGLDGLFILKDREEKVLSIDGITYDVLFGADAFLMVNSEDWERFVATRTHVPGVQ